MKFKVKTKDNHLIIRGKTSYKEEINEREIDLFARKYLRGFLKPKLIRKNVVEYTGPIGVSLFDRLKKTINKHDFLFMIEQILMAVQKIESNKLSLNHLLLDIKNVYINEVTNEIQFIYAPTNFSTPADFYSFIESIIYSVIPETQEDSNFVSEFTYFFKSLNHFNIDALEKYIEKEDRSVIVTLKKQMVGYSGFMTNKQQHFYEHYENKVKGNKDRINEEEPTKMLDEESNYSFEEATDILEEEEETTLLTDEEETTLLIDEDETTLLDVTNNDIEVHYPSLIRKLTNEAIVINKPVFRLGKEKSYVDYFVSNNNAVSRSHADIITRGQKYFIKDLNSKNKTYLNNQPIPAHCEVELNDGDLIRLGNEEFVFSI